MTHVSTVCTHFTYFRVREANISVLKFYYCTTVGLWLVNTTDFCLTYISYRLTMIADASPFKTGIKVVFKKYIGKTDFVQPSYKRAHI